MAEEHLHDERNQRAQHRRVEGGYVRIGKVDQVSKPCTEPVPSVDSSKACLEGVEEIHAVDWMVESS